MDGEVSNQGANVVMETLAKSFEAMVVTIEALVMMVAIVKAPASTNPHRPSTHARTHACMHHSARLPLRPSAH